MARTRTYFEQHRHQVQVNEHFKDFVQDICLFATQSQSHKSCIASNRSSFIYWNHCLDTCDTLLKLQFLSLKRIHRSTITESVYSMLIL